MKVLVDFDNVPARVTNQGPVYVVDKIVEALIAAVSLPTVTALDFRLYGGWDQNRNLTRKAQDLTTNLQTSFPRFFTYAGVNPPVRVRLSATLAQSLEALPRKILPNTFRSGPVSKRFKCIKPTTVGCKQPSCPLDHVAEFLNTGSCPIQGCGFTSAAVLFAEEQKLVDTMIVADLIHLANIKEDTIALVSSDDDMWPGILSCLAAGAHVVHVQTTGVKHSMPYKQSVDGRYTQVTI